jgi:hypothetical protein
MHKVPHRKSRSFMTSQWLSTARSTLRLAGLDGQVFSARNAQTRSPDTAVHRFDAEPQGDSQRKLFEQSDSVEARFAGPVTYPLDVNAAHTDPNRVVFFAPGPVTQADLARENMARAHHIRRRHRRRIRYQWLTSNLGIIMAVLALFALVWVVSDR